MCFNCGKEESPEDRSSPQRIFFGYERERNRIVPVCRSCATQVDPTLLRRPK